MRLNALLPGGRIVLAVGVASLIGALALSWRELAVLALGCALILLFAIPFVLGGGELKVSRELRPERVPVGAPASVRLTVENTGGRRSPRQQLRELVDGVSTILSVPPLDPGAQATLEFPVDTGRRGVVRLGPARVGRSDPCRLLQREAGQTDVDSLFVHPRTVRTHTPAVGLSKEVDAATSDHSAAGDIAFHAIRPYRHGDDARHVHWLATARAGDLMVRHFVDNRMPEVSVLLDLAEASWGDDAAFELGVEAAASLGISALAAGDALTFQLGLDPVSERSAGQLRTPVLDRLAGAQPDDGHEVTEALASFARVCAPATTTIVISGTEPDRHLSRSMHELGQTARLLWVTPTPGRPTATARVGGTRMLRLGALDDLARAMSDPAMTP